MDYSQDIKQITMSFLIYLHSIHKSKHWSMDPYIQVYGTEHHGRLQTPFCFGIEKVFTFVMSLQAVAGKVLWQ